MLITARLSAKLTRTRVTVSAASDHLKYLVECQSEIKQAIVATRTGYSIIAWPARPIFRAARLASLTAEVIAKTEMRVSYVEIKNFDHFLVASRHGRLLVHPIDDEHDLRVLATEACNIPEAAPSIFAVARKIARVLSRE